MTKDEFIDACLAYADQLGAPSKECVGLPEDDFDFKILEYAYRVLEGSLPYPSFVEA